MKLNMLRTFRRDPTISAYKALNGPFDYNKTPLAPLGSPEVLYGYPTNRNNFAPHCTDAIYVAPSMIHYCNRNYWVPYTQKMRISSSARIYPEHCKVPTILGADKTLIAASDLLMVMQSEVPHNAKAKLRHAKALQILTVIINNTPTTRESPTATPTVSASTDTTYTRVIKTIPSIHQRWTRRNTLMPTINEVNKPTRENETPQQSPTTNSQIQVPNRCWCQPLRVAKTRTVEGQLIVSKHNNAKNTSQKIIQSLINQ